MEVIAVAQHRTKATERACPRAERTHRIAALDLAGLGHVPWRWPGLALLPRAFAICWPERIHGYRSGIVGVHGAEVRVRLATDRIESHWALRRVEARERADHGGEVAAGVGERLVGGGPHRLLVRRQGQEAGREGGLAERQGEEYVVGVVAQRRCREGEVAAHARVGA